LESGSDWQVFACSVMARQAWFAWSGQADSCPDRHGKAGRVSRYSSQRGVAQLGKAGTGSPGWVWSGAAVARQACRGLARKRAAGQGRSG
jgi:hypothetical protein